MRQQTILVVSPNPDQSKLICDCLQTAGYQVTVANLGKSALEIIHKRKPDMACLDWVLPDLSSLAVIRSIRSDAFITDLPIILRGPNMLEDDYIMGLEAGADVCLKEPFHPEVFVARVRALLRRCHD